MSRDELLERLVLAVSELTDAEDWEKTLTDSVADTMRVNVLEVLDALSQPDNQRATIEGEPGWQVGIWRRREPADEIEARAMLAELARREPGWAWGEGSAQEDDGVFLVTVSRAFADEARERGGAERTWGEFHLDAEWPL